MQRVGALPSQLSHTGRDTLTAMERLGALRRTGLLDTPAEPEFDRLTALAARLLAVPVAFVCLIDDSRLFFKSAVGFSEPWASQRQMPLSGSLCEQVVASGRPLIREDTGLAAGRAGSAAVELNVAAYAGFPLVSGDGQTLGTFCVCDHSPRRWSPADLDLVESLTGAVVTAIELHTARRLAAEYAQLLEVSEERLPALVHNSLDVIAILAADGAIRYVSAAIERLLGYAPEELIGVDAFAFVHPDDRQGARADFTDVLSGSSDGAAVLEWRVRHRDGSWRWVEALTTNHLGHPLIRGIVINARAVTARKEAEAAAREAEFKYRTLVEHLPAVVYIQACDEFATTLYISPQIEPLLGYSREEWLADPAMWLKLIHPYDYPEVLAEHLRTNTSGAPFRMEYRMVAADGRPVWIRDEGLLVVDDDGRPRFWQGVFLNIDQRKGLEERLVHQAFHDPLTDLPNRILFRDRLESALAAARGDQTAVAVLFLDLDNFKLINDSLGHEVGDLLLIAVTRRLQGAVRPGDMVARFAGDEFTILLQGVRQQEVVPGVAEHIAEALSAPFTIQGHEVYISTSIGISLSPGGEKSADDLLRTADMALYRAKHQGKARYVAFDPGMSSELLTRVTLEQELRRAVGRGEFQLYWQPVVDLRTGHVDEIEALLRWAHPERGLVEPRDFIACAEETGSIIPIGRYVVAQAIRQARAWQQEAPSLRLSVNLSSRELREPAFVTELLSLLGEGGLRPHDLTVEITEKVILGDEGQALEILHQIKALGVRIVLDDFGAAHSSLAGLQRLPLDGLKLDSSLIRDLDSPAGGGGALVAAIIAMAAALGLQCAAVGVETAEAASRLRALGCARAQGFFFARPVPADEVSPASLRFDEE